MKIDVRPGELYVHVGEGEGELYPLTSMIIVDPQVSAYKARERAQQYEKPVLMRLKVSRAAEEYARNHRGVLHSKLICSPGPLYAASIVTAGYRNKDKTITVSYLKNKWGRIPSPFVLDLEGHLTPIDKYGRTLWEHLIEI